MMDSDDEVPRAAAGADARRRSTRASRCRSAGTARRTAGCARRSRRGSRCRARASCSRRSRRCRRASRRSSTRTPRRIATKSRSCGGCRAAFEPRVPRRHRPGDAAPVHGALRLGHRAPSRRCSPSATSRCMHCPGSNLKLGSGIAPVVEMRARGISVSLGADGAACNNRLDMFDEMRLAATLQAMRQGARRAAGARRRLDGDARRRAGARARGTRSARSSRASAPTSSSSTATGPHLAPGADPWSTLVYAPAGTDVRTGRWSTARSSCDDFELDRSMDRGEVARADAPRLARSRSWRSSRAGI